MERLLAVARPARLVPFTIDDLHPVTHAVVWSRPVTRACTLRIRPLAEQLGHPVIIRTTFADGTVDEAAPYDWPPADVLNFSGTTT
jgi:hypothetical protein